MPLTRHFSTSLISNFIERLTSNTTPVYVGIGHPLPWDGTDTLPAISPVDDNTVIKNFIYTTRVNPENITFMIPKVVWVAGTVFPASKSATNIEQQAHILNNNNDIFKCISNNYGAPSTVEPLSRSTSTITTSDGYIWKYMYTLDTEFHSKFITDTLIPYTANTTVIAAAVPGTIDAIKVNESGNNYVASFLGKIYNVAGNILRIDPQASSISGYYTDSSLYITGGTGEGQLSPILDSFSNSIGNFIQTKSTLAVDTTSTFNIGPTINIQGDGTGALAYSLVANNKISKVVVINHGTGYTEANVVVTGSTSFASAANVAPIISPPAGHGADPVSELYSTKAMVHVTLSDSSHHSLTPGVSYRQAALVQGLRTGNNAIITAFQTSFTTSFNVTTQLPIGRYVTGANTGAVGIVHFSNTTHAKLHYTKGLFANGETVSSGNTSSIISAVDNADVKRNTGSVLYYTNLQAINRTDTTDEYIKFIIDIK